MRKIDKLIMVIEGYELLKKKYETCKDCPDRKLRCHSTCKGYMARCETRNKEREARAEYSSGITNSTLYEAYRSVNKRGRRPKKYYH